MIQKDHLPYEKSEIAVLIPALNEEKNLQELLPLLKKSYRVIVIDNGSTDQTLSVAKIVGVEAIQCLQKGYGSTILAALKYLSINKKNSPKIIVIFDGDGTSPMESIHPMIQKILKENFELVIGQRCFRTEGSMPIQGVWGNWIIVRLIGFLTGVQYLDMGSLRAVKYETLQSLQMQDKTWGWNVEMQIKAAMRRIKICEMKIPYLKRKYGKSKISGNLLGFLRAGSKIMLCIFFYFAKEKIFHKPHKMNSATNSIKHFKI